LERPKSSTYREFGASLRWTGRVPGVGRYRSTIEVTTGRAMTLKPRVRRLVRRCGFEVTRFPRLDGDSLASHLSRALLHHPVDAAIDVGAHEGEFGHLLRDEVGFRGPIWSFEPDPTSYGVLAARSAVDPNWQGYNLALGRDEGRMRLHRHGASDLNSFRNPTQFGQDRFTALRSATAVDVEVRRLDGMLLEQPGRGVSSGVGGRLLLKVDTQGFDQEVLAGASGVLDRVDIIVQELSVLAVYDGVPTLSESLTYLEQQGFASAGMSTITLDGARVIEYDGVFVRGPGA
jgi:FkbM family methyltransferase